MRKGLKYNSSGYYDSTAFQAIKNIIAKDKAAHGKKDHKTKHKKSNFEKGSSENGIKG